MSIFGIGKNKKTSDKNQQMPRDLDAPDFPNLPEEDMIDIPEFSSYEPTIRDIKKEIDKDSDELEIPMREKEVAGRKMVSSELSMDIEEPRRSSKDEKPIYVKVDKYKDIIQKMSVIKTKLDSVENLMKSLENVRNEEEQKLETWRNDLMEVKKKLLSVDKDLSEV